MSDLDRATLRQLVDSLTYDDVETEHGLEYSGGSMLVLYEDDFQPVQHQISRGRKRGQKFYQRRILVLTDWEEI